MVPFELHYTLTRRQRLATELYPWLPCLAACLGFTLGIAHLSAVVSRWFLPLLVLPPLVARNFIAFVVGLVFRPKRPVDVLVTDTTLLVMADGEQWWMPLAGVIQVFRSEDGTTWTVLHAIGPALIVPAGAITADQLDYLKGFALRAAAARRECSRLTP